MPEPKITDILAYFEDMARRNKSIRHTDNECHYCGSWDEFNERSKNLTGTVMVVDEIEGTGAGGNADNNHRVRSIMIWILKNVAKKGYAAVYVAQAECEEIQRINHSKMKMDHEEGSLVLRQFNPNNWKYDRVPRMLGNWCGYLYHYPFQSLIDLNYDEEQWLSV